MGVFKLTSTSIKWLTQIDSKSAFSLKKEVVNLNYQDILLLGKIKTEVSKFTPGTHDKRSKPVLKDKILSFGYQGVGKWENAKIDDTSLLEIKDKFNSFIISKKWVDKVLVSTTSDNFWIYLNIKLK